MITYRLDMERLCKSLYPHECGLELLLKVLPMDNKDVLTWLPCDPPCKSDKNALDTHYLAMEYF